MARAKQTLLERYTTYLQNHRFVSLVILLGLVVIGIASFTDAVSRIVDLGGRLLGPSHSKSDQWTTVLRVKNRGPETISIERLCELNLTETDGSMIQNYEKARVILTPVRPGPDSYTLRGWEDRGYTVVLPETYVQSTLFTLGSATIHFLVREDAEFNNSIRIGSALFMLEDLRNGLVEIGINLPP